MSVSHRHPPRRRASLWFPHACTLGLGPQLVVWLSPSGEDSLWASAFWAMTIYMVLFMTVWGVLRGWELIRSRRAGKTAPAEASSPSDELKP